mmetsp:Transcript_23356/g.52677  ORF Transcript_23356/g.52677 Transcript_23356/m.52677 type:complete len:230 (+) Transcript_23356:337-1026(+)
MRPHRMRAGDEFQRPCARASADAGDWEHHERGLGQGPGLGHHPGLTPQAHPNQGRRQEDHRPRLRCQPLPRQGSHGAVGLPIGVHESRGGRAHAGSGSLEGTRRPRKEPRKPREPRRRRANWWRRRARARAHDRGAAREAHRALRFARQKRPLGARGRAWQGGRDGRRCGQVSQVLRGGPKNLRQRQGLRGSAAVHLRVQGVQGEGHAHAQRQSPQERKASHGRRESRR